MEATDQKSKEKFSVRSSTGTADQDNISTTNDNVLKRIDQHVHQRKRGRPKRIKKSSTITKDDNYIDKKIKHNVNDDHRLLINDLENKAEEADLNHDDHHNSISSSCERTEENGVDDQDDHDSDVAVTSPGPVVTKRRRRQRKGTPRRAAV